MIEKLVKLSDVVEELDRLIRTKQFEIIHGSFENIVKHFGDMAKNNPLDLRVIPKIAETLRKNIIEAYNDMTTIYAPEECGEESVNELRLKIKKYDKGTIGYIHEKSKETIKLLDELLSNFSA